MPTETLQSTEESQDRFLGFYARLGNVSRASEATGIHRATHYGWLKDDVAGYRARFEDTQQQWRECLETLVFERLENPQGNRGSDVLAIFALKKAWPAKYDDKPPVVNIDARSISAELAQIGRRLQTSEQKPFLEAPGGGAGLSESGYEG